MALPKGLLPWHQPQHHQKPGADLEAHRSHSAARLVGENTLTGVILSFPKVSST